MAKFISLDRFCGGALLERFSSEMAKIGRNIMDPNTDPEKARTLTIKLTFKPDKSRQGIKTSIHTNVSLAPQLADETMMLIGQDIRSGRIEMSEINDYNQSIAFHSDSIPARVEVVPTAPPTPAFDPETGEIYETKQTGPIDLRAAN